MIALREPRVVLRAELHPVDGDVALAVVLYLDPHADDAVEIVIVFEYKWKAEALAVAEIPIRFKRTGREITKRDQTAMSLNRDISK